MCINFKASGWSKSLLIFTMGFGTMWLAFGYKGVEAQGLTVSNPIVQAAGCISDLLICKDQFSRADFLSLGKCARETPEIEKEAEVQEAVNRIEVVLTAYSSTAAQTDDTPFITANGTYVHDGVVANNGLPFGTEIRIPEIYGDKVFSVEDRMHQRKSNYQFDIWFPTYEQAKSFGVKYAYVEVLKD